LLTVIVVLPLLGFLVNGLAGNRLGARFVSTVGCGLPILAFLLTVKCFLDMQAGDGAPLIEPVYTWAVIGAGTFEVAFYFDRLSAVMTLIVTGVGSLIHVYSIGYMKDDRSYARYFSYLNLFLFFMLTLVLGRSLLVLFVGWEGVGLASYLLIGFWFEDPDKARAGKKAFITNRIGDAGFLLGMFLLYTVLGTLDMDRINAAFMANTLPAVSASLVGILLFIGASGKSAQIPLHVWLPDAMAGPTPVSALIHAGDDGDRRCVSGRAPVGHLSARPGGQRGHRRHRRAHRVLRRHGCRRPDRHQEGAGVLDHLAARLHVRGAWRWRLQRGDLSSLHACLFQGLPVPRRGQRDSRIGRRAGYPQNGRARAPHSHHVRDLRRGDCRHRRHSAARRILFQG
jgi:hypothetical protein